LVQEVRCGQAWADHHGRGVRGAGAALACAGLPAGAAAAGTPGCSAGAHTLAPPGSHLYPDTGNGGYTSVHTLVHLVYDATTNTFLSGNRVVLTDRATQCLTSFSLDFERQSANTSAGPDMSVGSVTVNGLPAQFSFVQPTYPGDPNGQDAGIGDVHRRLPRVHRAGAPPRTA
jgi:hypothetical protein